MFENRAIRETFRGKGWIIDCLSEVTDSTYKDIAGFIRCSESQIAFFIGKVYNQKNEGSSIAEVYRRKLVAKLLKNTNPVEIIQSLHKPELNMDIALTCGYLDTDKNLIDLASAGHVPPIHFSATDRRTTLISSLLGDKIGHGDKDSFRPEVAQFRPSKGDIFLFFTDGITQQKATSEQKFDAESLAKTLEQEMGMSGLGFLESKEIIPRMFAKPIRPLSEDITILSLCMNIAADSSRVFPWRDGSELMLIPEGRLMMGADQNDEEACDDEKPVHEVFLQPYLISKYPVTNRQYTRFLNETVPAKVELHQYLKVAASKIIFSGKTFACEEKWIDHPVVGVTYKGAQAYCEWAGLRLPTEEEWERAARGDDHFRYPWGNNKPNEKLANYLDGNINRTTPVSQYPGSVSPFGCYDLAGNVMEWCINIYKPYASKDSKEEGSKEKEMVLRGGAFISPDSNLRTTFRTSMKPEQGSNFVGFRTAIALSDLRLQLYQ